MAVSSNSNDGVPPVARLSTMGGFCGDYATDSQPCVLEKSDCAEPEGWRSSRQMQGAPYRAHGGVCLLSETVRAIVGEGDGGRPFGTCVDGVLGEERCSWSAAGCAAGEWWSFPAEKDCSCDQVRVGGCEKDGEVFCAVSPDGCDTGSAWLDEVDIVKATATECYLCIAKSDAEPSPVLELPNRPATVDADPLPAAILSEPVSVLTAVLVTVGVMLALLGVVAGTALLVIRRKRREAAAAGGAASKDGELPPTYEISGNGIVDDDAISILGVDEFPQEPGRHRSIRLDDGMLGWRRLSGG